MSWRVGLLLGLMACGAETQTPKSQELGDFENWGSGIEDFEAAPVTEDGTGGTGTVDDTYDGGYIGSFNVTLNYAGSVCTFSNVEIQVVITDGELAMPFGPQSVSQTCTWSGTSNTYNTAWVFTGNVGADGVISGTLAEDSAFVFEGTWTGTINDLGGDMYQIISDDFTQDVSTFVPGSPTTISGSFILDKS